MADLLASIRRHRQALFALAMVAAVAAILWLARGALPAFFIGLALVFVLDPIVSFLARRGVPRWAAVLISYVMVVAVFWGLIAYAVPPITRQAREFVEHLPELGAAIGDIQQDLNDWWADLPLPAALHEALQEQLESSGQALGDLLAGLLAPTLNALVRAATFVVGLVVVPVWLFFVLKDRERFSGAVAGAFPTHWRTDVHNLLAVVGRIGGRWVRGQLLLGLSIFIATTIGLSLLVLAGYSEFGQFTLILALIAGVLEWLPIIGPILAAVPALLIALSIDLTAAVAVIVLYTGIQQLENQLLVPKVMGDAVELHPAVLILALVVGGTLFGIGGAVLAAPTVAVGRDLYRYGFHRLGGQPPMAAFDLTTNRPRSQVEPDEPVVPDEPQPGVRPAGAGEFPTAERDSVS